MRDFSGLRFFLRASCAVAALTAATVPASAGGFAVREQSSEFQGTSFAGDAASGGGLSGMFWNPAIAAYAPKGYSSESDATGIFGHVDETAQPGSVADLPVGLGGHVPLSAFGLPADSGNMAKSALVPGSYMAYRIDPKTVLALSINSPFGISTDPSNNIWAGQTQARFSNITTYDVVPTIGYKVSPQLSVGVGVQIDYIEATLRDGLDVLPNSPDSQLKGNNTAVGFTAGLNWTPTSTTSIGLGYKSAISHDLKGTVSEPGTLLPSPPFPISSIPADSADVSAKLKLPDIVTLSARQAVTSKFDLLGTVEWTHWSDLQALNVVCSGASPILCPGGSGTPASSLQLGWHDSWLFSLGGEYAYNSQWKFRSGLAYELSPIQNPDERTAKLPDQNRIWLSAGASYALSDMIGLDLAYSHIWGLGGGINRTETESASPLLAPFTTTTLVADVNSSVDIISGAVRFKLNP